MKKKIKPNRLNLRESHKKWLLGDKNWVTKIIPTKHLWMLLPKSKVKSHITCHHSNQTALKLSHVNWDPVQYRGYCTGCNSFNMSCWFNLTVIKLSHINDPCAHLFANSICSLSPYHFLPKLLIKSKNSKYLSLPPNLSMPESSWL